MLRHDPFDFSISFPESPFPSRSKSHTLYKNVTNVLNISNHIDPSVFSFQHNPNSKLIMSSLMKNIHNNYGFTVAPDTLITPHKTSSLPSLATIYEEGHQRIGARKRLYLVVPLLVSAIFMLLASKHAVL